MVTLPIQIEDEILGDPSASPGPGTAPDDAQSSLKVQPEEALAPAEPTVEVMIVNTISELQVALAQSEEHIEIRKHLVVYDETCRSPRNCVHGFPRQPAEQTDANGYRYVPSDFTVNGQTYVSPWTRSIRVRCKTCTLSCVNLQHSLCEYDTYSGIDVDLLAGSTVHVDCSVVDYAC